MVSIPSSSSLDLTKAMTLEAWVKPTTVTSMWRTVVLKERSGNLSYGLYAGNGSGKPSGHVYTTSDRGLAAPQAIATNTWVHLASTWDGTTARLYVNGNEVAKEALAPPAKSSSGALRLGGNTVWAEWFKGLIDEVRVYNRALSASDVKADMNVGATTASLRTASATPQKVATKAKKHKKKAAKKHHAKKKQHGKKHAKKHGKKQAKHKKKAHRTHWL